MTDSDYLPLFRDLILHFADAEFAEGEKYDQAMKNEKARYTAWRVFEYLEEHGFVQDDDSESDVPLNDRLLATIIDQYGSPPVDPEFMARTKRSEAEYRRLVPEAEANEVIGERRGTTVMDLHTGQMQCEQCGMEWSPSLQPGGAVPRGGWDCPNGCDRGDR